MNETTSNARRVYKGTRPGGRSQRVRAAIIEAASEELREVGYGELTMGSVARRADVALSTVHRRWDSKAALVADTVVEITSDVIGTPDLGRLDLELAHFARAIADGVGDPQIKGLLRSLLALPEEEYLRVRGEHWHKRYAVADEVMRRAIKRGEIPDQPFPGRVVELISSTIWMRILVTGAPVTQKALDRLVADAILVAKNAGRTA